MPAKRLGEILIEKGIIRPLELETALEIQSREKSILGRILIGENYLRSRELHEAIAERFGLEFIDLTITRPDFSLLKFEQYQQYFDLQLVPFRETAGDVTIAVTGITEEIKDWAVDTYPEKEVKFLITAPYDVQYVLQERFSDSYDEEARLKLWKKTPHYSARKLFNTLRPGLFLLGIAAAFAAAMSYKTGFMAVILVMNLLFFTCVSFKNLVFLSGQRLPRKYNVDMQDEFLPVYTILLPLYHETETLPKLIGAINKLDYPKSKLDVKFVVEADDMMTINAIKAQKPPQYMEIIPVPFSLPRTKPKACNYALNFARGSFITIYDAEDIPEPAQLKTVLARFALADRKLACVQARLNYYNYNDNLLTRWFALEYAIWFDSVMSGLEFAQMPIPLGGTSNHVRASVLKEIGGWDAFNVTEDADLGLRLAQEGYRTETIDSLTLEEAPNKVGAWMKQRTRWIKGFMQTYLVHMRNVGKLTSNIGWRGVLSLQFFLGIPILIYLSTPFLLIASAALTWGHDPIIIFPAWLNNYCWFNLLYGSISHMSMCVTAARAKRPDGKNLFKKQMLFSSLTFPLYSILHVFAAFRALYQLVTDPHYWDKTQHGVARTGI